MYNNRHGCAKKIAKKVRGFEPGDRRFESLRACHVFNGLGHHTRRCKWKIYLMNFTI